MRASKRELDYAAANFGEVHHTTLNPEGPGVVRIHLVPPVVKDDEIGASVAILNGQDVIPVNTAWSILLTEFIREVNKYAGEPISDAQAEDILEKTCDAVKKVYPIIGRKRLKRDVHTIMQTFRQVAYGEPCDTPIGYLTLGEYAPKMRAPHRMDLLVSAMTVDGRWHCNQKCVHCYAAGQADAEEPELSTAQWKQILDRCRAIGVPQVTFTGGEPTMRGDLPELIEYGRWFITRLNTNGVKLTPEYCRSLREAALDSCQITFYSCDEAVHNRLVGGEHWAQTVAGIPEGQGRALCDLLRPHHHGQRREGGFPGPAAHPGGAAGGAAQGRRVRLRQRDGDQLHLPRLGGRRLLPGAGDHHPQLRSLPEQHGRDPRGQRGALPELAVREAPGQHAGRRLADHLGGGALQAAAGLLRPDAVRVPPAHPERGGLT